MSVRTGRAVAGWLWAVAVAAAPVALAPAQGSAQAQAQAPAPVPPVESVPAPQAPSPPPAPPPRGLFGDLDKLFEAPAPVWSPPPLKSPAEVIEDFNARANDAGAGLPELRRATVATGRAICPVSANGAPDCQAAAERLCRDKGFKDGKSMDVEAAQVCSARALLTNRTDDPGACRMENYVTRAMCQ